MYSTLEVSKLTGASLRQLQYWDEQKLFVPRVIANRRRPQRQYSREQVSEVEFVIRARKYANLKTIRELLVVSRTKTISLNRVISAFKVLDSVGLTL